MCYTRNAVQRFGRRALLVGALCCAAAGCGVKKPRPPAPVAAPTPPPPAVSGFVQNIDLTLTSGRDNATIVRVKAAAGTVEPAGGALTGTLTNGTVTLFQNNKPAAVIRARQTRFDQKTRTVTAERDVVVRSLADPTSPAIRADTMIWRYDTQTITGKGNVLITRKPDYELPGESFTADTRLRTFTLHGGDTPATGTF